MRIISFDKESGTLLVELPGFPCYEVFDVPQATVEALRQSDSPQDYFNEHIWGNNFEHDSHWPDLNSLLLYMGEHMMFDLPVTVHTTRGDNDTPLHVACVWGDLSAIDLLVTGGANVNARGDLGTTPIYNAVSFERVRSVTLLLKAGATVDDPNKLSNTARQRAFETKNSRLIALFQ
jgi:ankyrin repeat protein